MKRNYHAEKQITMHKTLLVDDHPPLFRPRQKLGFGERSADTLTSVMGSWIFIFLFIFVLAIWIAVLYVVVNPMHTERGLIVLNLFLSCIAALQAPIILMSQNRQAKRDRQMAEYDYHIDRQSEREIRELKTEILAMRDLLGKIHKKD